MFKSDINTELQELAKYYLMEIEKLELKIKRGIKINDPELVRWCVDLRNCYCSSKINAHYVEIYVSMRIYSRAGWWRMKNEFLSLRRYHLSMEFSSGDHFDLDEHVLQKKILELYLMNQVSLWQCGVAVISCITSLVNKIVQKAQEIAEKRREFFGEIEKL